MLLRSIFITALFLCPLILQAQTQSSDPTNYQKGLALYNLGSYEQALDYFKNALNDDPNSWESYQMVGYCDYRLGQKDEALSALNESIKINPNNAALKAFIDRLSSALAYSPSPASNSSHPIASFMPPQTTNPTLQTPTKKTENAERSFWLKISGEGSYSALGDLSKSADVWNQETIENSGTGNASYSSFGYGMKIEGTFNFNKETAIGLNISFRDGHNYRENFSSSSDTQTENFDPMLVTASVELYRYFPEQSGRFFFVAGVLYGQAIVPYNETDPSETVAGTLSGGSVGFDLGLGNEFNITPDVQIGISARFQYLAISSVQSNYTDSLGNTGQLALAKDPVGDIGVADTRLIGQYGLQYAVLDFTGIVVDLSADWRLF